MKTFLRSLCLFFILLNAEAQPNDGLSKYKPSDLFPANSFLPAASPYRLASGEPGPAYWQNRADYEIDVKLDDQSDVIEGIEAIVYQNNSPHSLTFLWLQLDQNVYKNNSKGRDAKLFLTNGDNTKQLNGGFMIKSINVQDSNGNKINTSIDVQDTRMKVALPQPLPPGKSIKLNIAYTYNFPKNFKNADFNVNRTDILPTKNGAIYAVAQWYPRLCVLDDVTGWNTLPYLGNGEFYLEYGNFNVNITVPSAYLVEASGDLINPEDVLTPVQLERWKRARTSKDKVYIRTAQEVTDPSSRPQKQLCTWKFKLNNARDFAWTASRSFIWDGIGIDLPEGKTIMGSSLYPVESNRKDSWQRSAEYIAFTIKNFSEQWYQYPYNKAVNVASNLDGMEYPGLVFCSAKDRGNMFWAVVNHELGHTWFPMIVGSNERKYAWMDEGLNAFIDNIATKQFNGGEFRGYDEIDIPRSALFADSIVPIMTRPDVIPPSQVYNVQYQKVAYALTLLREQILGEERFDDALRKYIRDWAYKHPTPNDFFASINNTSGEDLTWFWKSLFIENYKLDQRVMKVINPSKNSEGKAMITIQNMEKGIMPLHVGITYKNGEKELHKFPVEIWQQGSMYTFSPDQTGAITKVVLDSARVFTDIDQSNNCWPEK